MSSAANAGIALLVLASCGGAPAQQSVGAGNLKHERPHEERLSDLAQAVAKLPLVIDGLTRLSAESVPSQSEWFLDWRIYGAPPPCADGVVAKIEATYSPYHVDDIPPGMLTRLYQTTASVEEIASCYAEVVTNTKRQPHKDPRVWHLFDDLVFAQLTDGWVLQGRSTAAIEQVLAAASGRANPLRRVLAREPAQPLWSALAIDYTTQLLGVSSYGTVYEYADAEHQGPTTIRVLFSDHVTATDARKRIDRLGPGTQFGPSVTEAIAFAREHVTSLEVVGSELVLRGQASQHQLTIANFGVLGIPVKP